MKDLFLFVRPPRPIWPFNSSASAFWPPLAFASLAAMLRQRVREISVEILDAPILEMGWRSLEAEICRRRPAFVGIGEEAVSCVEALRLARIAKCSGARVIAGGCFFGHVAQEVLRTGTVDFVVHGEGELTLVELIEVLQDGSLQALRHVNGISFLDGEELVTTPPRTLIANLDDLPMPAYDLLPVHRYGAKSINHPGLAAIELGRGCIGSCDFCILWRQMGRWSGSELAPSLRIKSPERLLEEVHVLVRRFERHYLGWVDPCFNADPSTPGRLAELLLRENLRIGQSAWIRTDALARDARSGALESCVRAGLNEVYLGIERSDAAGLAGLGKSSGLEHARDGIKILRSRFPGVLAIGSFIYGLPGDTGTTIRAMYRLGFELDLDQCFFIPLTPLPGTNGWRPELWDPTGALFRSFGFLPASDPVGRLSSLEQALLLSVLLYWPWIRAKTWLRHLCCGDARRRRVQTRLQLRGTRFLIQRLLSTAFGDKQQMGMVFPAWYES